MAPFRNIKSLFSTLRFIPCWIEITDLLYQDNAGVKKTGQVRRRAQGGVPQLSDDRMRRIE